MYLKVLTDLTTYDQALRSKTSTKGSGKGSESPLPLPVRPLWQAKGSQGVVEAQRVSYAPAGCGVVQLSSPHPAAR